MYLIYGRYKYSTYGKQALESIAWGCGTKLVALGGRGMWCEN